MEKERERLKKEEQCVSAFDMIEPFSNHRYILAA